MFDITADPDGNLWYTEYDAGKVGRITTDGIATEFSAGIALGAQPVNIVTGAEGNLWFTEAGTGYVARITPGGGDPIFSDGFE